MKKGFAVNPDLTSMPLAYLGRILQEWIAMGMLREIDTLEQINLILIFFVLFCLSFIVFFFFCFCVFSVPDRYKQKHNSKKAEEGI